jgi:hypothetical protein
MLALAMSAVVGCSYAPMHAPTEDGRATLTLPGRSPKRPDFTLRAHPAIEAYRLSVDEWATPEEQARFDQVDTGRTFGAPSTVLQSLAMERFVHRIVPLVLEAQTDPSLRARGQRLRALEVEDTTAHRLDPRVVFAALGAPSDGAEPDVAEMAHAMRSHAEAIAEFAEAYAAMTGVSVHEADRVALAVDGVGTVGLLLGRILEMPGVPRAPVVAEAELLLNDLVRMARRGER